MKKTPQQTIMNLVNRLLARARGSNTMLTIGALACTFLLLQVKADTTFRAVSAGFFAADCGEARLYANGNLILWTNGCGTGRAFSTAAFAGATHTLIGEPRSFDTWYDPGYTNKMALIEYLEALPSGTIVLFAIADEAGLNERDSCYLFDSPPTLKLIEVLTERFGSRRIAEMCYRGSWAMISKKDAGEALAESIDPVRLATAEITVASQPPPAPPLITAQPSASFTPIAGTATFRVSAKSLETVQYQWKRGGLPITDAIGPVLSLTNVTLSDRGSYHVEISNLHGRVVSEPADLVLTTNPAGEVDRSLSQFSSLAPTVLWAVLPQPEDVLLVAGLDAEGSGFLTRVRKDGSVDSGFQGPSGARVYYMAADAAGRIVCAGDFSTIHGVGRNGIARLTPKGQLDQSFNAGTMGGGYGISSGAVQSDGKLVLVGGFTNIQDQVRNGVVRLHESGSIDFSFNANDALKTNTLNVSVSVVVIQPDGKLLIAGSSVANGIARLMPDGTVDPTFVPPKLYGVSALALQKDAKILIGGSFFLGEAHAIGRLMPDGSRDFSFDPGKGMDGSVSDIEVQDDGRILIGGWFNYFLSGLPKVCPGIARLEANGRLDRSTGFGSQRNDGWVNGLLLVPNGRLLVYGSFQRFNGRAAPGLVRLLMKDSVPLPVLEAGKHQNSTFMFSLQSHVGWNYSVETKRYVGERDWSLWSEFPGNGGVQQVRLEEQESPTFVRVRLSY